MALLPAGSAGADAVMLRGGTTIEGICLEHRCDEHRLVLRTTHGTVVVRSELVVSFDKTSDSAARYSAAAALFGQNASDQFDLAQWCESNGLADAARRHFEATLLLDKDHAEARRLLGYVRRDDLWVKLDATEPTEPPPVAVDGPAPLTPADEDVILPDPAPETRQSLAERRQKWNREVLRLTSTIEANALDRSHAARDALAEIRDPMAVPALIRAMITASEPTRTLIVDTLGAISGPEATSALALVAVLEPSAGLRWTAMQHLRGRDAVGYRPTLIAGLQSRNREVIFNAAEAAAELGDVTMTPYLVAALTSELRTTLRRSSFPMLVTWPLIVKTGTKLVEKEVPKLRH